MVFGGVKITGGKTHHDYSQDEQDPDLIHRFHDVRVYPEEKWYNTALRHMPKGNIQNIRMPKGVLGNPSAMLSTMTLGVPATVAMKMASDFVSPSSNTAKVASPGARKPEITADCLELTKKSITAKYDGNTVLVLPYDKEYILSMIRGGGTCNQMILDENVLPPDKEKGGYSNGRYAEMKMLWQALMAGASGFMSGFNFVTGIEVDRAGLTGKKFVVKVAHVEIPVEFNIKGVIRYSLKEGASAPLTSELKRTVTGTYYDLKIEDKDDKKHGIDNEKIMRDFSTGAEGAITDTFNALLHRSEKKELQLSETFLKDFAN